MTGFALVLEHDGTPLLRVPADVWEVAGMGARLLAALGLPRVSVGSAVVEWQQQQELVGTLWDAS